MIWMDCCLVLDEKVLLMEARVTTVLLKVMYMSLVRFSSRTRDVLRVCHVHIYDEGMKESHCAKMKRKLALW